METAQEFALQLQELSETDCREMLEVFLDNLDGDTRALLADCFRT